MRIGVGKQDINYSPTRIRMACVMSTCISIFEIYKPREQYKVKIPSQTLGTHDGRH